MEIPAEDPARLAKLAQAAVTALHLDQEVNTLYLAWVMIDLETHADELLQGVRAENEPEPLVNQVRISLFALAKATSTFAGHSEVLEIEKALTSDVFALAKNAIDCAQELLEILGIPNEDPAKLAKLAHAAVTALHLAKNVTTLYQQVTTLYQRYKLMLVASHPHDNALKKEWVRAMKLLTGRDVQAGRKSMQLKGHFWFVLGREFLFAFIKFIIIDDII